MTLGTCNQKTFKTEVWNLIQEILKKVQNEG